MDCNYIIVQAGGKGTRMEHLTTNKPKALVPVDNLPMLFHLFQKFPDKKFIIIGDYKYEVLKKYLFAFAKVKYLLIDARGEIGTCSGLKKAISLIPEKKSFMLIWSDLVLGKSFEIPTNESNYIGISKDFKCRWLYDKVFVEEPSYDRGVAGLFIFKNKDLLVDVPQSGEFVRWLKSKEYSFETIDLYNTKEYGLIDEYNSKEDASKTIGRCRPFNKLTVQDDIIIKEGIDEKGKELAIREKSWYKMANELEYNSIPKIQSFEPFAMQRIKGKNIFLYNFSIEEKKEILKDIIISLKELHEKADCDVDYFSVYDAYYKKTMDRLNQVRDLIPFANDSIININGKACKNVFYYQEEIEEKIREYKLDKFKFIHGDCTFSNLVLNEELKPILIDPRGYFGHTELFGDPNYDWAKLYYSIVGNYDQFNAKKFRLDILDNEVKLDIESNKWEELENDFFELLGKSIKKNDIRFIHGIIWLSLTTYAWEDYDSICGAFYNGLYNLEGLI